MGIGDWDGTERTEKPSIPHPNPLTPIPSDQSPLTNPPNPQSPTPNPQSLHAIIRDRGPLTVADFIALALYDSEFGYYARVAQRSGRAGDFFTSVDVGPLFGELIAAQVAEMARILDQRRGEPQHQTQTHRHPDIHPHPHPQSPIPNPQSLRVFDLLESGAGNGRLSADVLRALRAHDPDLYSRTALHLVEASAMARAAQASALGDVAERLHSSGPALPESFAGVLFANELLDALPVHQVVMREDGLKEVYVIEDEGRLRLQEGEPSTTRLAEYLADAGAALEPGWRVEIGLCAVDWIREAARRLTRGFLIIIDYGHLAPELYSATHAGGTLTTFSRHRGQGAEASGHAWLEHPGEQDITAHVDFTSVRAAAEREGLQTLALIDQTYFVLGLTREWAAESLGAQARALKTLMLPGGLGSTMKVLILGRGVGTPTLRGASFGGRLT